MILAQRFNTGSRVARVLRGGRPRSGRMILAQRFNAGSGIARVLWGTTAERSHDFSPAFQHWVARFPGTDARPYIDSSKREPVYARRE